MWEFLFDGKNNLIFFQKKHCFNINASYICTRIVDAAAFKKCNRAISSVGSEHLVYTQRVGGSNPSLPTIRDKSIFLSSCLFLLPSKAFSILRIRETAPLIFPVRQFFPSKISFSTKVEPRRLCFPFKLLLVYMLSRFFKTPSPLFRYF